MNFFINTFFYYMAPVFFFHFQIPGQNMSWHLWNICDFPVWAVRWVYICTPTCAHTPDIRKLSKHMKWFFCVYLDRHYAQVCMHRMTDIAAGQICIFTCFLFDLLHDEFQGVSDKARFSLGYVCCFMFCYELWFIFFPLYHISPISCCGPKLVERLMWN